MCSCLVADNKFVKCHCQVEAGETVQYVIACIAKQRAIEYVVKSERAPNED